MIFTKKTSQKKNYSICFFPIFSNQVNLQVLVLSIFKKICLVTLCTVCLVSLL